MGSGPEREDWWRDTVFYQIYPLSFQDSNGDGYGDLRGIISRLDHLSWLGVGAVWLSPIYPTPMLDFGYDISDYTGIDPIFGTLAEFDELLAALHARNVRVILDVVPNHTSDRHPWFLESRAARENPRRDWYVWADPGPDGGPPNNWLSRFGGSAWQLDEETGQYYYHSFLKEQPDLNWHNEEVRAAFAEVLRFWLKRGVDGFRVDASAVLAEDPLLRDDPPNPDFDEKDTPPPEKLRRIFTDARPETMGYLEELRAVVDEFPGRVLLGEVQGGSGRIGQFYNGRRPRFHLPLNFLLLDVPWDIASLTAGIDAYLNAVPEGCSPVWILGSHDKPRIASRLGLAQARIAAMLLLTLPGTPIFFAGDEIGAPNIDIPSAEARDPFERLVPGYGLNRDSERGPMRWSPDDNAGFTAGTPWLPLGEDVAGRNVATQRQDEHSILWLYRRLLALRKQEAALRRGAFQPLRSQGNVLLFTRTDGERLLLVALNVGGEEAVAILPGDAEVLLSTHLDCRRHEVGTELHLRADEGVVAALRR